MLTVEASEAEDAQNSSAADSGAAKIQFASNDLLRVVAQLERQAFKLEAFKFDAFKISASGANLGR